MAQTAVTAGDFANTSDSLANRQRTLKADIENLSATLGNQLLPVMERVLAVVGPIVARVGEWVEANPELARNIVLASLAVAGLVTVIGALSLALLAFNPIALVIVGTITAIMMIIYAVNNAVKLFGTSWGEIWEGIKATAKSAYDFISSTLINPLISGLERVINFIDRVRSGISSIGGKVGSSVSKLGNLAGSAFSKITPFAEGGIVTGPTLGLVGEAGPEAIIPLSKAGQLGGGNTYIFNVQGDITDRVKRDIMRDLQRQVKTA